MFLGLVFLSLGFLYLTLLSFLDCRMSVCVWPTQTRRVKSGCSWALAYVLLTALLFVFINVNLKNKSSPLLLCPSPTLLPYKAPHAHTQNHSLFVFNTYLSMLDMFLKTRNMTHPLSRANQPSHQISHQISVLAMRVYYWLLWPFKKCNSCNMILCREAILLPSNIFEMCSLLGLLEMWYINSVDHASQRHGKCCPHLSYAVCISPCLLILQGRKRNSGRQRAGNIKRVYRLFLKKKQRTLGECVCACV